MEESILKSTKKILGLEADYTPFDLDIITHINAAFSILGQIGGGLNGGISIQDDTTMWDDAGFPPSQLNLAKTYVFLKVRLLFDPPGTSFLLDAMQKQVEELEWRLNISHEATVPPINPPKEDTSI